jgi:hypothetical protein
MRRVAARLAGAFAAMIVVTEVVSVVRRVMVRTIRTALALPHHVQAATLLRQMMALPRAAKVVPTPGSLRAPVKAHPVAPRPHTASRLAAPRCSYRATR